MLHVDFHCLLKEVSKQATCWNRITFKMAENNNVAPFKKERAQVLVPKLTDLEGHGTKANWYIITSWNQVILKQPWSNLYDAKTAVSVLSLKWLTRFSFLLDVKELFPWCEWREKLIKKSVLICLEGEKNDILAMLIAHLSMWVSTLLMWVMQTSHKKTGF
mgnify:CR=1 FL=1